jgi:hypothetical protein
LAGAGCVGDITKLHVESDDNLFFDIKPTGDCVCNFATNGSAGFFVPASQLNKDEQYAALLSAFMAREKVMSWFDWSTQDGSQRCISHSVSFSR